MPGTTTIIDWLGTGDAADIPLAATLDALLVAGATARYFAQDTGIEYALNRNTIAWVAIGGAGAGGIDQLTGDVTAGPGVGSQAATLATVNASVGSFTYTSLTVNAKGLITAASSGSAPAAAANPTATAKDTAVNGAATTYMRSDAAPAIQKATAAQFGLVEVDGTTITASGGVISAASGTAGINQLTGDVTAGPGVGSQAATLANTAVAAGSYTYTALTVDAKGRLTAASSGAAPPAAANPTATAKDTAVNGVATTFMRSDGAPAVQKASSSQFGLVEVDGTSITASGGVISAAAGTGVTAANPTATAGPAAVNGSASTFMRSDGAPAIQKATSSLFGIVEVDGTTITASGGVISAVSGAAGLNQLTGDVTAGPGTGSQAATLASTAVTPGSYTHTALTVDAKGRLTAASSGSAPAAAANPTATASDTAVNGVATTFMRSDGAPAVQKASSSQFGLVEVDGTTITATAGVISAAAGTGSSGANPTATAGPAAVNGSASTFMRSDGAPAIQKASAAQFGIVEVDGTSITATAGVISAAAGPGAGAPSATQINSYTTGGTTPSWTKPTGAKSVTVICFAAGGGGGAGQGAATSNNRNGGSGGGGGCCQIRTFLASDLTSPVTVTVPVGGAGGTTSGATGTAGGSASFGAYLVAYGGGRGQGGSVSIGSGGAGGGSAGVGGNGASSASIGGLPGTTAGLIGISGQGAGGSGNGGMSAEWGGAGGGHVPASGATGITAGGASLYGGGGGGGGASLDTSNNARAAAAGGNVQTMSSSAAAGGGGAAGTATGSGNPGTDGSPGDSTKGGQGGGGGACNGSGTGGKGGAGGANGGGGGGGAGGTSTQGNGGDGGAGAVYVITSF